MTGEEKQQEIKKIKKLSIHDFYFETSLYNEVKIEDLEEDILNGEVDAYSRINHIDTTYKISSENYIKIDVADLCVKARADKIINKFTNVELICKRKENDKLNFNIIIFDSSIMKVGQFPSLADIQFAELGKKYNKVLQKEDLKDFKKAIGLISHGAGAGSFVYLRKIFERLIYETYENNKDNLGINEKDFNGKRMGEKIESLKDYLPSQLLKMKGLYGILSKGVHELAESECLKYFSPIKLSIELILDQKIEIKAKLEKDEKVKKEIAKIHGELK